ncbi:alpha/beta fold hydrolase [Candidatus Woesearchaeota archaeon]|nr:alpha/beta fold hydrolase [Nanoarchaeota archaeon]MCB9370521.1 alpha/beta fold hydrolase [Candidatus Woesearchaeota archaeon]USN43597.1 MAG: alpha/beta fold hydrolase [Candidatus Woesearchaeota archaeon]
MKKVKKSLKCTYLDRSELLGIIPSQRIKIKTLGGLQLETFLYGEKEGRDAIIMCHGFSGSSSNGILSQIAQALSKKYVVCRFDFRGQGASEGDFYDSSITLELEDLSFVVDYVKKKYSPKNLILLGHSFGSAIAFLYARGNTIQGMISLSGEGDLEKAIGYEFSVEQMKNFEEKGETTYVNWSKGGKMDRLGKQFLDDMRKYSTLNAAKLAMYPTLFLHGTSDDVIPCNASKEMFALVSGKKELIFIEGGDHTFGFFAGQSKLDEVISHIQNWLGQNF